MFLIDLRSYTASIVVVNRFLVYGLFDNECIEKAFNKTV